MESIQSPLNIPVIARLRASLTNQANGCAPDILIIRDPARLLYASRYNPLCVSHGVDLVIYPDSQPELFVHRLRQGAVEQLEAGRLAEDLKVTVYEAHDYDEPSNFIPTLHAALLQLTRYAKHTAALHAWRKESDSVTADFSSMTIAIDLADSRKDKEDEIQNGFPGAKIIDWIPIISRCQLALDRRHSVDLAAATEMVVAAVKHIEEALLSARTCSEAKGYGKHAIDVYHDEYWPDACMAGVPSRENFSTDGWAVTVTPKAGLRVTPATAVAPGMPYWILLSGYVNGMGIEWTKVGGCSLLETTKSGISFLEDLPDKLANMVKPNVSSQRLHWILDNELQKHGYVMLDIRPGHAVGAVIHEEPTISRRCKELFPVGSVVAVEPATIQAPDGEPLSLCMGRTSVMTDQGLVACDHLDKRPTDDPWTIGGLTFRLPDLGKARRFHLSLDTYLESRKFVQSD